MTVTATEPPAAPPSAAPPCETFADLHARLGGVPLSRIRCQPPPGTATEADVLLRPNGEKRLFELVEGTLVEKPMGWYESIVALVLSQLLLNFLDEHDLGVASGPDGTVRLAPGLVRIPDVAFFSWERFPNRQRPAQRVPALVPDLAVEVLSAGNAEAEMEGKLNEYFSTGVRLVWYVDPEPRTVRVYTSPTEFRLLTEDDTLEGGAVLPGLRLSIREWFARAWRQGSPEGGFTP